MSAQSFYQLGLFTYFELNRNYIAEVLCINKEDSMSVCHGQCFLKKNLNLADDTEKAPVPKTKDKSEIPFFLISDVVSLSQVLPQTSEVNFSIAPSSTIDFPSSIFHPPWSVS
jgi:hypothetical protein